MPLMLQNWQPLSLRCQKKRSGPEKAAPVTRLERMITHLPCALRRTFTALSGLRNPGRYVNALSSPLAAHPCLQSESPAGAAASTVTNR